MLRTAFQQGWQAALTRFKIAGSAPPISTPKVPPLTPTNPATKPSVMGPPGAVGNLMEVGDAAKAKAKVLG